VAPAQRLAHEDEARGEQGKKEPFLNLKQDADGHEGQQEVAH